MYFPYTHRYMELMFFILANFHNLAKQKRKVHKIQRVVVFGGKKMRPSCHFI